MTTRYNRRDFLKRVSLATTATMISPYVMASQNKEFDCVVLGAGMAGITAAKRLTDVSRGYRPLNVLVLEGSGNIGGRIVTRDLVYNGQKLKVEVGAEYLHREPNDIPLGEEINKLGVQHIVIPKRKQGLMYHPGFTNKPLKNFSEASKDWGRMNALRIFRRISKVNGEDMSAKEFLEHYDYNGLSYDFGSIILTGHVPASLEELSVGGFNSDNLLHQLREKNDHQFVEGFSSLVEKMADGLDIRLDERVEKIEYGSEGVTLYTSNGKEYHTKTCINTCSVGMLKSGEIEFSPELPSEKQDALGCLNSGPVSKVILQFDRKFWPKEASILMRIDKGRRSGRSYFPHHQGEEGKPPMLTAFFAGDDSTRVRRKNNQRALRDICSDLDAMFPEEAPVLDLLTKSVQPIRKNWVDDSFAHGGYSFQSANQPKHIYSQGARKLLADGRETPGLFWAGEATTISRLTQPTGVHGAHTSGLRAAEEVLHYLTNQQILDPKVAIRRVEIRYETAIKKRNRHTHLRR